MAEVVDDVFFLTQATLDESLAYVVNRMTRG